MSKEEKIYTPQFEEFFKDYFYKNYCADKENENMIISYKNEIEYIWNSAIKSIQLQIIEVLEKN